MRVDALDLGDLDSVRGVRRSACSTTGRGVDILINNAAIMACPETRVGPGWEAQFATNHLGHFALANLLWPLLADGGGARVVALTSTGHKRSGIRWDDLQFEHGYDKWEAYGQAKTANSLFAVQLDALGQGAGVRAFAVHPGGIFTPLQRHLAREEMVAAGWIDERRQPRRALQDARAGRRDLDLGRDLAAARRHGRRLLRELRHRRADAARTRRPRGSRASTRTRSTPSPPRACGRCRPS